MARQGFAFFDLTLAPAAVQAADVRRSRITIEWQADFTIESHRRQSGNCSDLVLHKIPEENRQPKSDGAADGETFGLRSL